MNRIVRENYPVSDLPEDLRTAFEGQDFVTVSVIGREALEQDKAATSETLPGDNANASAENLGGQFSRFKHLRRSNFRSSEEVDAHLSKLRDEWAHRER